MLKIRTNKTDWLLFAMAGCLIGSYPASAAISIPLAGGIAGTRFAVQAACRKWALSVILYNHLQRPLGKVTTDERGEFKLLGLFPALYSIKVSSTAFVPATKEVFGPARNPKRSECQPEHPFQHNSIRLSYRGKWQYHDGGLEVGPSQCSGDPSHSCVMRLPIRLPLDHRQMTKHRRRKRLPRHTSLCSQRHAVW